MAAQVQAWTSIPEEAALSRPIHILPVPWRDPHTVSREELGGYIARLEAACLAHPASADLRTCLGMAHAMNFDVYRSMDVLAEAVSVDETHFFARLKYAELFFRLRALPKAEEETAKALALAGNPWELSLARKQLQEIRYLIRNGTQKPAWTRPLRGPALAFLGLCGILCTLVAVWR
jgi:hypothetical protein